MVFLITVYCMVLTTLNYSNLNCFLRTYRQNATMMMMMMMMMMIRTFVKYVIYCKDFDNWIINWLTDTASLSFYCPLNVT